MASKKVSSMAVNVAYVAQRRGRDTRQCFSYKEYGHIARNCPKKVCNYYKKEGHLIKDYRVQPQNRQSQTFQADVQSSSSDASPLVSIDSFVLIPVIVQHMIVSAFTALGLQGTDTNLTSSCIVDSDASNHMTV